MAGEQTREELLDEVVAAILEEAEAGSEPDPARWLARHPELAEELAEFFADRARVRRWTDPLRAAAQVAPWREPPSPGGADAEAEHGRLGDFRIVREVGRGGMGVVYEAEQLSLGRRVALKVLPFAATMDPKQLQRFHNEARAAACLQHPHIVAVHAVGVERGVHFYAMQFIDGDSLAAVIAALHRPAPSPDSPGGAEPAGPYAPGEAPGPAPGSTATAPLAGLGTEPGARGREFYRRVARLGIEAAEALEYAHGLGIVHRDVKPGNLLVDHHGKLWVADFGLARTAADSGLTMTGDLLGTLRYMSPEQALARHGLVDHRTDVYSLGVTLYELLTGRPAVDGKDREEILNAITLEEPRRPCALDAAIPRDLETLVLKAITKNPADRYATAQELADDLGRYLRDDPIRARRPTLVQRGCKWARRNRRPVLAAALLLLALVAGIVGTTIGMIRAEKARAAASEQRGIAEAKRKEAEDERGKAEKEKERALLFRDKALDALRATTGQDVEKLIGAKGELGANERAYLEAVVKRWQAFAAQVGTDEQARALRGEGHFRVAYLWQKLGRRDEARVEYQKARDIQQDLAEQFPAAPRYQLAETHYNLGILLRELGRREEGYVESAKAFVIRQKLAERFPEVPAYQRDLAHSHNSQGVFLHDLGKPGAARSEFAKSRDIWKKLAKQFPAEPSYPRHLALAHNNLGLVLKDLGKREEAAVELAKARDVTKQLAEQFPGVPDYRRALATSQTNLGTLLAKLGKRDEARVELEKARDVRKKLAEQFPAAPDDKRYLAGTHSNLGNVLKDLGKRAEARAQYEQARDIQEKLTEHFPDVPAYRHELARTCYNLANLLWELGKRDDARIMYAKARDLMKHLAGQFPAVPGYRRELAGTHGNLGYLLNELGKRDEARVEYEQARDLWQQLSKQFPAEPGDQQALGNSLNALGLLLADLGKRDEARVELGKALDVRQKLAREFPAMSGYQIELGGSYCNLGSHIREEGKPADSLEWFARAIATLAPVHEKEPHNGTAQSYLRNSYSGRAIAQGQLHKYAEAVKDWDRAIELSPRTDQFRFRLARAASRLQAGQAAEAVAEVAELTKGVSAADQWYSIACFYAVASGEVAGKKQEYADRAMGLLQKAKQAGFRDAALMAKDAELDPLRRREDFKKLLAELQDGKVKAKP